MANFKRKRCRTLVGRGSKNDVKRKKGDGWFWWQSEPRSHNIVFHTRPQRRKTKRLLTKVLKGEDPENITWPLARKPHIYYW